MKIFAGTKDNLLTFEQKEQNGSTRLFFEKELLEYEFLPLGNNRFSLIHNHTSHLLHIVEENGLFHIHIEGAYFAIRVEDERMRALRELVAHSAAGSGEQTILAPIPGLISRILISEGQKINAGDPLIILEAMKMENEIRSENEGFIKKIMVENGKPVEKDQPLIVIAQEGDGG